MGPARLPGRVGRASVAPTAACPTRRESPDIHTPGRRRMAERTTRNVNGQAHAIEVDDPGMPLLYALRDELGLSNPHFGCGLGQCGACTVHINGEAVRSCVTPLASVTGEVTTLAGLGTPEKP